MPCSPPSPIPLRTVRPSPSPDSVHARRRHAWLGKAITHAQGKASLVNGRTLTLHAFATLSTTTRLVRQRPNSRTLEVVAITGNPCRTSASAGSSEMPSTSPRAGSQTCRPTARVTAGALTDIPADALINGITKTTRPAAPPLTPCRLRLPSFTRRTSSTVCRDGGPRRLPPFELEEVDQRRPRLSRYDHLFGPLRHYTSRTNPMNEKPASAIFTLLSSSVAASVKSAIGQSV